MWRYLVGGVGALALAGGGVLILGGRTPGDTVLAQAPAPATSSAMPEPLPERAPEATAKTREEKRFGRYDKDRDGRITRDEYLASRRKAYAKLDSNGDGRLSFDEWAAKTTTKFGSADRDRSGAMDAAEFATTAVKRKPARAKCPPGSPPQVSEES
ncbi:EF-hand domain-containing protein [Sphingomonas sp.]|uniref:EF-hand domain-containing protein n=1 Tax=Sphingomonas sp. TaxID=28214 RepID=UPI0035B15125